MSKELEYKFFINDNQKLQIINYLKENGAEFISKIAQKDVYFIPKFRDFEINGETIECVRIRTTDRGSVLCYKKIHREANPIYCDEYETKIEDANELEKIFLAISFEVQMTIDKTREIYRLGDFEFDFDSVKNLGELFEIELKSDDELKFDEIFEVLNEFGIKKSDANYEGIQTLMKKSLDKNKGENYD